MIRDLPEGMQDRVYEVRDVHGKQSGACALKVLKNPNRSARFVNEVEAIARLDHPNVLRLIDSDLHADPPYLVTEYCRCGSLDQQKAPFWHRPPQKALRLFREVCEGLQHAHTQGVRPPRA